MPPKKQSVVISIRLDDLATKGRGFARQAGWRRIAPERCSLINWD